MVLKANQHICTTQNTPLFCLERNCKTLENNGKNKQKNHKAGFPYLDIKEGFSALKNNQTIEKRLRKISWLINLQKTVTFVVNLKN
jgi:hypothetical protein